MYRYELASKRPTNWLPGSASSFPLRITSKSKRNFSLPRSRRPNFSRIESYLYIESDDYFDLTNWSAAAHCWRRTGALPGDQLQLGLAVPELPSQGPCGRCGRAMRRGLCRAAFQLRADSSCGRGRQTELIRGFWRTRWSERHDAVVAKQAFSAAARAQRLPHRRIVSPARAC